MSTRALSPATALRAMAFALACATGVTQAATQPTQDASGDGDGITRSTAACEPIGPLVNEAVVDSTESAARVFDALVPDPDAGPVRACLSGIFDVGIDIGLGLPENPIGVLLDRACRLAESRIDDRIDEIDRVLGETDVDVGRGTVETDTDIGGRDEGESPVIIDERGTGSRAGDEVFDEIFR